MLHHLFYFGVLLPTLIVVIFFIIFLICWYPLNLRQRFTKPKFQGGCHNSTHTSLASAISNYPNSKEYWDQLKLSRSETRQTSLSACTKYVPGEFPGLNDENWRYMSRRSIEEELGVVKDNGDVRVRDWLRGDSMESVDQWPHQSRRASSLARTNYALLDDESDQRTGSELAYNPRNCESQPDLSPLSDDTIDERPPRPDDDRHTSQLHFICGGHRNGYCPLVQHWDQDAYPLPRSDSHSPMELGAKYLVNADCSLPHTWTNRNSLSEQKYTSKTILPTDDRPLGDRLCTSFKTTETTSRFSPTLKLTSSFKSTDKQNNTSRRTQNGYTRMTFNPEQTLLPMNGYSRHGHRDSEEEKSYSCSPYAVTEIRNPVISV